MKYQLHDSQINRIGLGKSDVHFQFSQGFWRVDENGKEVEQMKNCEMIFEIENNGLPIEEFITVRISKRGGAYKTVSLVKFMGMLGRSAFDVDMEYDCSFANRKMLQLYSHRLSVCAEIFIEDIKKVEYVCDRD